MLWYIVVSVADPMWYVSEMLFPGRTELVTLVKTGIGQAAYTLNNPQVEYVGVLLCRVRNNCIYNQNVSVSPVTNKKRKLKDIIFLPCLVLREARTKHE